ncbi:hypothetical protein GGE07_005717 [Sinorhizobium terangae]|uniref:Ferritin-like domain-containing protein n=1 Tax=Sinorhizobium terangae TaxID=110322 RepID=A0A6N7LCR4_SINTE|nr:hypothetical protein [Sinorhizobium terangae]MBB4189037.1 hypothetical protein [Sinorhizobium terangae]MQX15651.1 hypothetical protein [Sinorhizobium terangae]
MNTSIYTSKGFEAKYHLWSSLDVLGPDGSAPVGKWTELAEERRPYFEHDMSSEYDSIHLLNYLKSQGMLLSDGFKTLHEAWLRDEQNHYAGLREIYHRLYDTPREEIDRKIKGRIPDFRPIAHLIQDEFSLLVAVAFDEITSARAYAYDRDTYTALGGEPFLTWVKYAGRDEGVHARNALELLKYAHGHRLNELAERVDAICQYELAGDLHYHGTFLFDHDTDDFSKELFVESGRTLCSFFNHEREFADFCAQLQF